MTVSEIVDEKYLLETEQRKQLWANVEKAIAIMSQLATHAHGEVNVSRTRVPHNFEGEFTIYTKTSHWWQAFFAKEVVNLSFHFCNKVWYDATTNFVVYTQNEYDWAKFLASKLREKDLNSKIIKRFEEREVQK